MTLHPKLVVFDLDGTLAISKTAVTKEMGTLLARLLFKVPVAIMSGASTVQFEKQVLPVLPEDAQLDRLYLFPTNAASCVTYHDGKWHPQYDHAFSAEEKDQILEVLHEALKENNLDTPPEQLWGPQIEDRGAQIAWSALGQLAPVAEKKKWDPDFQKRLPVRATILRRLPTMSVSVGGLTTIDITRKGITKAYGIEQLTKMTGVLATEMLYVGDALMEGGNDSVVIPTGIQVQQVSGPDDTATVIEKILPNLSQEWDTSGH